MRYGKKLSTEIRREQIMEAVFQLAAEKGVKGLTTAAIARKVGMSEANLYRHFRNKEDIIRAAVEKIGEGLIGNRDRVLASRVPALALPREKLKRLFIMHLRFIESNAGIPRIVFSEELHLGDRKIKSILVSAISTYTDSLRMLFIEGQNGGAIRKDLDPQALAMTFVGMIQFVTLKWSLNGFSFSLASLGRKLWNNFEKSIALE